jgi:hypothetical protein
MVDGDKMRQLFTHYVQMRQGGQSRDTAWRAMETTVLFLPPEERQLLLTRLHDWEHTDGKGFRTAADVDDTQNKPPAQFAEKRNVIRRIDPLGVPVPKLPSKPAELLLQPDRLECPRCQKLNSPADIYCYSCGAILKAAPPKDATRPLDAHSVDNAFFGENWVLYLKLQTSGESLRVQPRTAEVILGRKTPDSAMIPDVDLSTYGATDKGVSRLHASVRRQDQTLVLADLGSTNHTFINGQRVHSHEVRALHDGDELRLGSMVLYAYFREA